MYQLSGLRVPGPIRRPPAQRIPRPLQRPYQRRPNRRRFDRQRLNGTGKALPSPLITRQGKILRQKRLKSGKKVPRMYRARDFEKAITQSPWTLPLPPKLYTSTAIPRLPQPQSLRSTDDKPKPFYAELIRLHGKSYTRHCTLFYQHSWSYLSLPIQHKRGSYNPTPS